MCDGSFRFMLCLILMFSFGGLQIDFRWAGEANIAIAIELPAGGEATRMVPKVSDLRVAGTLRVMLCPLVEEVPGFGAAIVSLK